MPMYISLSFVHFHILKSYILVSKHIHRVNAFVCIGRGENASLLNLLSKYYIYEIAILQLLTYTFAGVRLLLDVMA